MAVKVNPFRYGVPVRGANFVNREGHLRAIFNRISNGDSVAITGEPHVGKTSLLLQLIDPNTQKQFLQKDQIKKLTFSHISLRTINTPKDYWEKALGPSKKWQSNKPITDQLRIIKREKFSYQSIEKLSDILIKQGRYHVLVMDEFECIFTNEQLKDSYFHSNLHEGSRTGGMVLVMFSRNSLSQLISMGRALLKSGSPLYSHAIDERLLPFDESVINRLLNFAVPKFSLKEKTYIRRVAGRNPFLIQAMAGTFYDTPATNQRPEKAAELFYRRIGSHFSDVWEYLSDEARTVAVMLSLQTLDGSAHGSSYNYGEVERADLFEKELKELEEHGLAEVIEDANGKYIIDTDRLLVWRGKKWMLSCEAFAWWIRDKVIADTRSIPFWNDWLVNQKYRGVVTQKQLNNIQQTFKNIPPNVIHGVAGVARILWDEIQKSKK